MHKTTDNQKEIFDIVDEKDNVIGRATRGEVHKNKNLIHRSIGVFIFNKQGELFMQKRSNTKDTDPGKWTISCSGHVNSGDNYETTAKRELKEELGVNLSIVYKSKFICVAPKETEMCTLFNAFSEGPFQLLEEEISEGKFVTQNELRSLLKRDKIELSFMGREALETIGWL